MEIAHQPTKKSRLTLYILIAMILGIVAGYIVHENYEAATIKTFSDNAKLLTTIFLRMVQMIIAPIVFATLVVGIAKLGDMKTVGRVGGKAMLWFITASLISLGLGLILVNIFKPGVGVDITNTDMAAVNDLLEKSKGFGSRRFSYFCKRSTLYHSFSKIIEYENANSAQRETKTELHSQ